MEQADQDSQCHDEATTATPPESTSTAFQHASTTGDKTPANVARQKRKRTSPEDQAVLEYAYKSDPKPDKTKRLQLVERVSLDEKEVQVFQRHPEASSTLLTFCDSKIWFQNRRQSSRRRTKPLSPFEIAQFLGSSSARNPEPFMGSGSFAECESVANDVPIRHELPVVRPVDSSPSMATSVHHYEPNGQLRNGLMYSRGIDNSEGLQDRDTPNTQPDPVVYLANIRSAPSSQAELCSQQPSVPDVSLKTPDLRPTTTATRPIRLSMTSEGKAIIRQGVTPSPPKVGHQVVPEIDPIKAPNFQRSTSARSGDSRSWEFWCDKEARHDFESAAEKDASGSAAGAIGLYRSATRRSVLGVMPTGNNIRLQDRRAGSKRQKLDVRVPLSRSSTAQGRLQGQSRNIGLKPDQEMPKLKSAKSAVPVQAGEDSDKENISPREASEMDPEVELFMRGASRDRESNGDELDVVQALLSLSR